MSNLLILDDLAARWQVTRERAFRRIKGEHGLKAINLGTPKFPELRFRLETVQAWEAKVESTSALAPQDKAPVEPTQPPPNPAPKRSNSTPPAVALGPYRGKFK